MKALRRIVCVFVCVCLTPMCGCSSGSLKRYQRSDLTLFDTVSVITGYAASRNEFDAMCDDLFERLGRYSRLYDIYYSYDGITNLRDVNMKAASVPVSVDPEIIALLEFGVEAWSLTNGKTNIAMGSVLSLWHDCREQASQTGAVARVPDISALTQAAEHTDIRSLIIDSSAMTVGFDDPQMTLDVGAVAKGFAAERVAEYARSKGYDKLLFNIGGSVITVGSKPGSENWVSGIQNPEAPSKYVAEVSFCDLSLVTSGSYQRYFTVDGTRYHHIIDSKTLYPDNYFASVSVIAAGAGLGDALSTALFCMSEAEGRALLSSLPVEAGVVSVMWIYPDGSISRGNGFEKYEVQ